MACTITTEEDHDAYLSTIEHKKAVEEVMNEFARVLKQRGKDHDNSKLEEFEFPAFSKYTPMLRNLTYGSDEYKKCLAELDPTLQHHYANNRHHPEHFKDGIKDMHLIDLIELFADWYCASKRHADGNIRNSIEFNKDRFNMSDDMVSVFINTIELVDK